MQTDMKKIILKATIFLLIMSFHSPELFSGELKEKKEKIKNQKGVNTPMITNSFRLVDINNIAGWLNNDGQMFIDKSNNNAAGFYWPKPATLTEDPSSVRSTFPTAIFDAGIWVAANYAANSNDKRTAAVNFTSEFLAGKLAPGGSVVGLPSDARYRIYKIRRGDTTSEDYKNWPFDDGAPALKKKLPNGNETSEDSLDASGNRIPRLIGDQTIWWVSQDVNLAGAPRNYGGTSPMGCELQHEVFGFQRPSGDPLGDIVFIRYKIINRSTAIWDSVFIGFWSDPDLGAAGDDKAGSDKQRKLGFVYNSDDEDTGQPYAYGTNPPASGFTFFEGPTQKLGNFNRTTDTTLGASGFVVFKNVGGDPEADPLTVREVHFCVRSKNRNGAPYGGLDASRKFQYTGDPELGTGILDNEPGDKRFVVVTGSSENLGIAGDNGYNFRMNPGDTATVVVAAVVARGTNNLNAVTKLKRVSDKGQGVFTANFQLPNPPEPPKVTITQLQNEIILNWENEVSQRIEAYKEPDFASSPDRNNPIFYNFEGYKVIQYQGAGTATGGDGESRVIAYFDKINGIRDIVDTTETGDFATITPYIREKGVDFGIRRSISIKRNYFASGSDTVLKNGTPYYFGVVAYGYNPNAQFSRTSNTVLESAPGVTVAIPQSLLPGTVLPNRANDLVVPERYNRGDENVSGTIIDPTKLKGKTYRIGIIDTIGGVKWNAVDAANGDSLVRRYDGKVEEAPIIDGIRLIVTQKKLGIKSDVDLIPGVQYTPSQNRYLRAQTSTDIDYSTQKFPADNFGGGAAYPGFQIIGGSASPGSTIPSNQLKRIILKFSTEPSKQQLAYRYLTNVSTLTPARDSSFIPFIKVRTNGVYQDTSTVPFQAFEVDEIDGDTIARQLNVLFVENNDSLKTPNGTFLGRGSINGKWEPTYTNNGGKEVLYITGTTYDGGTNDTYKTTNIRTGQRNLDLYYVLWLKSDSGKSFKDGDALQISPNYALASSYEIKTNAIETNNGAAASNELAKANVFPNPYLATHSLERNTLERFVTFTHLPTRCTIRIFDLTGQLVNIVEKNDASGTLTRWNLDNRNRTPVASGIYIAYIDAPGIGTKILKLAIIQREERLDAF